MNMMKEYLGNDYSDNHLRNFCLYWMKAAKGSGDKWRKENDLDCLYFDGDLRADTLMSAWTPVKWVADCLNREYNIKFYKKRKNTDDPYRDLKLLAEDRDAYLPPKHELVLLLDEFLELAELRCNYILLPDRKMNTERYNIYVVGKKLSLFDEVPATLYHIFDKRTLGKYFNGEEAAVSWVKRERLDMGFYEGIINKDNILPLISHLKPSEAKWLTKEDEIREALIYMRDFLSRRKKIFATDSTLKIYIDMDGVVADFDKGLIELLDIKPMPQENQPDEYQEKMWAAVRNYRDGHFYADLEPTTGMEKAMKAIIDKYGIENVEILTGVPKPKRKIFSASDDKVEWCRKYISENIKVNTVIRDDKINFCTGKNCILIDDYEKNINEWEKCGGTGMLFTGWADALDRLLHMTS